MGPVKVHFLQLKPPLSLLTLSLYGRRVNAFLPLLNFERGIARCRGRPAFAHRGGRARSSRRSAMAGSSLSAMANLFARGGKGARWGKLRLPTLL